MAKIPVRTILTQAGSELNQQLAKQSAAWNKGTNSRQQWQQANSPAQQTPVQIVVQSPSPASGARLHNMEPVPLQAEPLIPQELTPQSLKPDNEIPEGESAFDTEPAVKPQAPPVSATLRYLTHICNQGLSGAMITNEILEPPLAMRQGYLSRYRRRGR